jgi:hypothetical protein
LKLSTVGFTVGVKPAVDCRVLTNLWRQRSPMLLRQGRGSSLSFFRHLLLSLANQVVLFPLSAAVAFFLLNNTSQNFSCQKIRKNPEESARRQASSQVK